MVGAILPDIAKIVLRPLGLFIELDLDFRVGLFFEPLHSLVGASLLALTIACFISEKEVDVKWNFLGLAIGCLSHFGIDCLSTYGCFLFAPITWHSYALWLFWPDSFVPLSITTFLLALVPALKKTGKL
jgi:membrane-bound metal-dependent hydrolase YbcI (DUF457 family)